MSRITVESIKDLEEDQRLRYTSGKEKSRIQAIVSVVRVSSYRVHLRIEEVLEQGSANPYRVGQTVEVMPSDSEVLEFLSE